MKRFLKLLAGLVLLAAPRIFWATKSLLLWALAFVASLVVLALGGVLIGLLIGVSWRVAEFVIRF